MDRIKRNQRDALEKKYTQLIDDLVGREDATYEYMNETDEEIEEIISKFESDWATTKFDSGFENLSLSEQKKMEVLENNRRLMWTGTKFTPLPADGHNLRNYIDLELAGLTIPLGEVIEAVKETIKQFLEDNTLNPLPLMQDSDNQDYVVAGVTGGLIDRFRAYFSRKDGRGKRKRCILYDMSEFGEGSEEYEALHDELIDINQEIREFQGIHLRTMNFICPSAANMGEFILQQFLYRAGHHVDFSGLVRQGGVTVIGSDTFNDQAIWTVYVMVFKGGVLNAHRDPSDPADTANPNEGDEGLGMRKKMRMGSRPCDIDSGDADPID